MTPAVQTTGQGPLQQGVSATNCYINSYIDWFILVLPLS